MNNLLAHIPSNLKKEVTFKIKQKFGTNKGKEKIKIKFKIICERVKLENIKQHSLVKE